MASGAELRVILVGRTGLNAKLRADPTLELLPVRTPLEAIGELSDPIDESSPAAAVVILGADAVAAAAKAAGPKGSVSDFLNGLKRVDPTVRVLKVSEGENNGEVAGLYDGVVPSGASPDATRDMIRAACRLASAVSAASGAHQGGRRAHPFRCRLARQFGGG